MTIVPVVDQAKREVALNIAEYAEQTVKSCELGKQKLYKKHCLTQTMQAPNLKFLGVLGEVNVNAPLKAIVAALTNYGCDVSEKSPKQVKTSILAQKFHFFTDADKKAFEAAQKSEDFAEACYFAHSVSRSPASAIVSHRDFVVVGTLKMTAPNRCVFTGRSTENEQRGDGFVRGNLVLQHIEIVETDGKCKVKQAVIADPCGSIPAWVFNSALDQRNDILLLLKGFAEGEIKPEYD